MCQWNAVVRYCDQQYSGRSDPCNHGRPFIQRVAAGRIYRWSGAYDDAVEGAALDLAVENAEIVELPAEMVEDEVHRAMNEFMGNMQRQGISPEMYFQITGTTQEDLHKQYEADADKRVKTNLVIEAVAAAEGFDATEEEIQKEINDLAAEYNMEVSQVSALLSPEMLKHDITMKKAVEVITSTAKVK